jgi:hypothetical protein
MEDIGDVIQRKIWTAEQLLSQAQETVKKSKRLSPDKKRGITVTIRDWSEEKVKKHVEIIRDSITYPIRHQNKKKLESIGITVEKIPQDVFDNEELMNKIITLFKAIRKIDHQLADILIKGHLIEKWAIESTDEIEQKLQSIVAAESSFKEIFQKKIDKKFKNQLLKKSLEDTSFLEQAEETISNIEYLNSFEVLLDYTVPFEEFHNNLDKVNGKIKTIIKNYAMSENEIKRKIEGKELLKAFEILEQMESECAEKKKELLRQWKVYASSLRSLGDEISEPPNTLPELERSISSIKKRCLKYVGKSGLRLLSFIRGEEEFPNISITEIRKALEALRPIFLKSLE